MKSDKNGLDDFGKNHSCSEYFPNPGSGYGKGFCLEFDINQFRVHLVVRNNQVFRDRKKIGKRKFIAIVEEAKRGNENEIKLLIIVGGKEVVLVAERKTVEAYLRRIKRAYG